jgi:hypothetical protein
MRNHGRSYLHPREYHQTWWVVYCQVSRRPWKGSKSVGSGARYALQTFLGTEEMVKRQFGESLARAFLSRQEAITLLGELNLVDSVQSS